MMITLPRRFKQVCYLIILLLSIVSLAYTQQETTTPRTIQLFAKDDDPSGRIPVEEGEIYLERSAVFRKRAAIINPALLTEEICKIRSGDKLAGYLFEDEYVEATVERVMPEGTILIMYAVIDGNKGRISVMANGKRISLKADLKDTMRDYRCLYDRDEAGYVVKEVESKQVARERRAKAVAEARMAGPKIVQIFTEDDDPSNRMTWDETDDAFVGFVRWRKASVNPLLFADRIDEINVGDTIAGYLFEDEYFEGIVTSRLKGGKYPKLQLKIKGDDNIANWVLLISDTRSFRLHIFDKTRKKEFRVSSSGLTDYHVVVERDPSKIKILPF